MTQQSYAVKTEIYFITNEEANEVLRSRILNMEGLLMSMHGVEHIEILCEKIYDLESRLTRIKLMAEEIKAKENAIT